MGTLFTPASLIVNSTKDDGADIDNDDDDDDDDHELSLLLFVQSLQVMVLKLKKLNNSKVDNNVHRHHVR